MRFVAATQSPVVILIRGRSGPVQLLLAVCLPRALPGSSHAPDQRAASERSLSQTTRGTFFMVFVFVPRPGGEAKTFQSGAVTTRLRTSSPFRRGTACLIT